MITRRIFRGLTAAIAFAALLGIETAAAQEKLTSQQEKAVERLVKQYILDHPEILIESIDRMRTKRLAQEEAAGKRALLAHAAELTRDPTSPFAGNPKGDVVMVEFFDYRCGVCKRVLPIVLKVLKNDSKLKLVYKEWPILGPESVFAARAALASRAQGKYVAFHNAMMKAGGALNETVVMKIAQRVGLDTDRLRRDMEKPEVADTLKRNFALAEELKLQGTPSFVVGDTFIRGGRNYESMKKVIAQARKKGRDGT